MDAKNFPARLRELREQAGLTQQQLAERSGLGLRSITYFEAGNREPVLSSLLALAAALDVDCNAFTEPAASRRKAPRGRPRKGS